MKILSNSTQFRHLPESRLLAGAAALRRALRHLLPRHIMGFEDQLELAPKRTRRSATTGAGRQAHASRKADDYLMGTTFIREVARTLVS